MLKHQSRAVFAPGHHSTHTLQTCRHVQHFSLSGMTQQHFDQLAAINLADFRCHDVTAMSLAVRFVLVYRTFAVRILISHYRYLF
ncbi:hypothetical protein SFB9_0653 [Klebsiella michiganensis]|nr:hypothetical protein SFB9_0653 [Klebsiella michiganensis]